MFNKPTYLKQVTILAHTHGMDIGGRHAHCVWWCCLVIISALNIAYFDSLSPLCLLILANSIRSTTVRPDLFNAVIRPPTILPSLGVTLLSRLSGPGALHRLTDISEASVFSVLSGGVFSRWKMVTNLITSLSSAIPETGRTLYNKETSLIIITCNDTKLTACFNGDSGCWPCFFWAILRALLTRKDLVDCFRAPSLWDILCTLYVRR